jgi:hypothetical protein
MVLHEGAELLLREALLRCGSGGWGRRRRSDDRRRAGDLTGSHGRPLPLDAVLSAPAATRHEIGSAPFAALELFDLELARRAVEICHRNLLQVAIGA